jgi:hypothetical protein
MVNVSDTRHRASVSFLCEAFKCQTFDFERLGDTVRGW